MKSLTSGESRIRGCIALAFLAAIALLPPAALPTDAGATRAHRGNLIVSFDAAFFPRRLPRHRRVPISVRFAGSVQTEDHSPLPRLRRLELGLAAGSRIDVRGLPSCPLDRLRNSTARQALRRCPGALVGRGSLRAEVYLPHQAPLPTRASLLAFNGRGGGRGRRPSVWVQAFSSAPPASFVLPFSIRPRSGTFATELVASVPRSLGPWPHLSSFQIRFAREFVHHGVRHSYLSASCAVPPRFTGGLVPFASASYFFAGGAALTATVERSCHVR